MIPAHAGARRIGRLIPVEAGAPLPGSASRRHRHEKRREQHAHHHYVHDLLISLLHQAVPCARCSKRLSIAATSALNQAEASRRSTRVRAQGKQAYTPPPGPEPCSITLTRTTSSAPLLHHEQ